MASACSYLELVRAITQTPQDQIDRLTADLNEMRGRLIALEAGPQKITVVHRRGIRWGMIIFGLLFMASCVAISMDEDSSTRRALDEIEQGQQ